MSPRERSQPRSVAKISDVAAAAGVSPATVSRVLNETATVSADIAERVRSAAAELGYQPFGPARALRLQRTRVWAVIIADIENPFFTAMVRGIEDVALAEGHRLVLCNSDEDPVKEAAYADIAITERMAGVIMAAAWTGDTALDTLLEGGVPVVAVDRRPTRHAADVDSVMVDNRAGAAAAAEHLRADGATRFACVTGPSPASTARERADGFVEALVAGGVPPDLVDIVEADFREEGGYAATLGLLRRGPGERPDALLVANNLMTLGALRAIEDAGLRVPDDVRLVGFDDAPWATLMRPRLTVVAQPTADIGRRAAELLATAGPDRPKRHDTLAPTLIVRESSHRG